MNIKTFFISLLILIFMAGCQGGNQWGKLEGNSSSSTTSNSTTSNTVTNNVSPTDSSSSSTTTTTSADTSLSSVPMPQVTNISKPVVSDSLKTAPMPSF